MFEFFFLSFVILLYTVGASDFHLLLPSCHSSPPGSCPVHILPITFPQLLTALSNLFPSLGLLGFPSPFAPHKSKGRFGRARLVSKGGDEGEKGKREGMFS